MKSPSWWINASTLSAGSGFGASFVSFISFSPANNGATTKAGKRNRNRAIRHVSEYGAVDCMAQAPS